MALSPLEQAYRRQLATVRQRVVAIVEAQYGEMIDEADILASFNAFTERVGPTIAVGQDAAQTLTLAFMASLAADQGVEFDPEGDPDIPGTSIQGQPLPAAMQSAGPLILGQIGKGVAVAAALDYGRFLATSFADNEVRSASDREQERQQARPEVIGWRGDAGECERCQDNNGDHDTSEEVYRHPGCTCLVTPIFANA